MKLRKPQSSRSSVMRAMRESRGFVARMARMLCVQRVTVYSWLRAYGLEEEAGRLRRATGWRWGRAF